jgi:outer membrane lipoprotein SlyB
LKASQKLLAGLMALVTMLTLATAQAQNTVYAPRISGFNVDEVRTIRPGTELNFDLYGTPGGRATIYIAGANRNLNLTETDAGQYEGSYTVGTRDHISASSKVTANLRVGNVVASDVLAESLVRSHGYRGRHNGEQAYNAPRIERFDVQGNDRLTPGNELVFTVFGTPGAKVDMAINGARGVFFLPEVRPGEYSGAYTIRRGDHIASNATVTANMRMDERVATATLGKPLLVANVAQAAPTVARYCSNCATVEAVNVVEVNGNGNYLGTIGGGLVGALLGNQVGSGNGRTAATVAGAAAGAYAGRNIERNQQRTQHYEVNIRFANGGTQTIPYENDPGLHVGEHVRLSNGILTRDQ